MTMNKKGSFSTGKIIIDIMMCSFFVTYHQVGVEYNARINQEVNFT